jgi:FAD/FMN-containing dehydrogenase
MAEVWTNWAGSVACRPRYLETPGSEAELIELVKKAAAEQVTVRVTGSGHSFTPLCAADGMLISLDRLQGVVSIDPARLEATVWAGTKIWQMGEPLWQAGLAMANMGDIDRQSLAGAISTGTHGTGRSLGSISSQVVGLRLVTAEGTVVECSAETEPELLKAGQVSLGALGIISQVRLRLVPAYRLHERSWAIPAEECLAELGSLIAANRHFEFFWSPKEDACAAKALNPVAAGSGEIAGDGVEALAGPPSPPGSLARYLKPEQVDHSYRVFPSERTIRFNEIEFALPEASGPDCFREIRELMQHKYPEVTWPIEYRTLAADDIDLSPAYGRASVTLSVHQAHNRPYKRFFADVEAIFRNHAGRPHWGKIHRHSARQLRPLYPKWDQFQAVRARLDPQGRFMNAHLRSLFDETS